MEVVQRGYGGQGNEFSYQMLLVSNYMLNHVFEPYSVGYFRTEWLHRLSCSLGRITPIIFLQQMIITAGFAFLILYLVKCVLKVATSPCVRASLWRVIKSKRMNGIAYWRASLWIQHRWYSSRIEGFVWWVDTSSWFTRFWSQEATGSTWVPCYITGKYERWVLMRCSAVMILPRKRWIYDISRVLSCPLKRFKVRWRRWDL